MALPTATAMDLESAIAFHTKPQPFSADAKAKAQSLKDASPALGTDVALGEPVTPSMAESGRRMTQYFRSQGLGSELDDVGLDADLAARIAKRLNEKNALERAEAEKARLSEQESLAGNPWNHRATDHLNKWQRPGDLAKQRAAQAITQRVNERLQPPGWDKATVRGYSADDAGSKPAASGIPRAKGLYVD